VLAHALGIGSLEDVVPFGLRRHSDRPVSDCLPSWSRLAVVERRQVGEIRLEHDLDPPILSPVLGESFGDTGSNSPYPAAASICGRMPLAMRNFVTSTARAVESSQFDGKWAVWIGTSSVSPAVEGCGRDR
jgi:hypothetical protein